MGTIGFRQLFDYDTWTYTYLMWDQENKEAVIIDPVREPVSYTHLTLPTRSLV